MPQEDDIIRSKTIAISGSVEGDVIAETKVVLRFWIVSFLLGLLSLATLKLR